jgi:hypothetical protein
MTIGGTGTNRDPAMSADTQRILDAIARLAYALGKLSVDVEQIKRLLENRETVYQQGIENTKALAQEMRGSPLTSGANLFPEVTYRQSGK